MAVRRAVDAGEAPSEDMRSLGLCRTSIYPWLREHARKGEAALVMRTAVGPAPQRAGWLLRQIQHLYALEKSLRETKAGPALRHAAAVPVLTRIKMALRLFQRGGRHLPQSHFGKALSYALNQWDALTPWLTDGRVELDNNLVENAIRRTVLGKKNYLFFGDAAAGGALRKV